MIVNSLKDVEYILEHPERMDYVGLLQAAQSYLSGVPGPGALVWRLRVERELDALEESNATAIPIAEASTLIVTRDGQEIFPDGDPALVEDGPVSVMKTSDMPLPKRVKDGTFVILEQNPVFAQDIMPKDDN